MQYSFIVSFNLKKDIMNNDYCGDTFYSLSQWNRIRLIWIAFEKNIQYKNDDKCNCLLSKLSKDIIKYIILFVQQ